MFVNRSKPVHHRRMNIHEFQTTKDIHNFWPIPTLVFPIPLKRYRSRILLQSFLELVENRKGLLKTGVLLLIIVVNIVSNWSIFLRAWPTIIVVFNFRTGLGYVYIYKIDMLLAYINIYIYIYVHIYIYIIYIHIHNTPNIYMYYT